MTGFFEEALKYCIGSLVGGFVTGVSSFILFSNKITRLTLKVDLMEKQCEGCKIGTTSALELVIRDFSNHRADDEKHNNAASHQMLIDILNRVMRIESRLFRQPES